VRRLRLHPVTELENTLSSVDADALAAVQRYAVIETELVLLVAVLQVFRRLHLYTAERLVLHTVSQVNVVKKRNIHEAQLPQRDSASATYSIRC